jgi:hypothetical protein
VAARTRIFTGDAATEVLAFGSTLNELAIFSLVPRLCLGTHGIEALLRIGIKQQLLYVAKPSFADMRSRAGAWEREELWYVESTVN